MPPSYSDLTAPRTWGWSMAHGFMTALPTHVGMVRSSSLTTPRTCSPHTRGWPRARKRRPTSRRRWGASAVVRAPKSASATHPVARRARRCTGLGGADAPRCRSVPRTRHQGRSPCPAPGPRGRILVRRAGWTRPSAHPLGEPEPCRRSWTRAFQPARTRARGWPDLVRGQSRGEARRSQSGEYRPAPRQAATPDRPAPTGSRGSPSPKRFRPLGRSW